MDGNKDAQLNPARFKYGLVFLALFLLLAGPTPAQAPFYQGKTLTIIQGRDPGGTGDVRAGTVVPFLQKYIPGNPNVVMEYMPGGGSRKAANHLFTAAKPDGLTIGNVSNGMVASAILKTKGVLYDLDKFVDLGSPFSSHHGGFCHQERTRTEQPGKASCRLLPENHEKANQEVPRDPEVIEVFNKLIGAGPLPTSH